MKVERNENDAPQRRRMAIFLIFHFAFCIVILRGGGSP